MNEILSWYNQNRKLLWIIIFTIIAVISLVQALNNYYKNNTKDEISSTINSTTNYDINNYSVITEQEIDENVAVESMDIINEFFNYCNSKKIEEAYNLLSSDCKQELYPTVNDFYQKYYNRIFTEQKSYDSKLWITTARKNTYRLEISKDLLATGQKDYMPIEEYYTIVYEDDGTYKLNINGYIGKEEINKYNSTGYIDVTIVCKKMYMDYETYEIKVQNNTKGIITFNTKQNTKSMYLQDENDVKYTAFLNEIPNSEFDVLAGVSKTLNIRFNRAYKPTINIEKIVFGDILNNNEQKQIEIKL